MRHDRWLLKLEGLSPTGSFKDRGAATAITAARAAGATTVVEDSSGNAGTAIAAYAAAAGLTARIFAPDDIVAIKARAIRALGAELITVSGPRSAVTEAALTAARTAYDVGHARDDAFLEGVKTIAYELFETLGPELQDVVTPVGQGTVLVRPRDGVRRAGVGREAGAGRRDCTASSPRLAPRWSEAPRLAGRRRSCARPRSRMAFGSLSQRERSGATQPCDTAAADGSA